MKYPVKVFLKDGSDTIIEIEHTQPLAEKTVFLPAGVDSIQVDPDLWVLKRVDSINGVENNTAEKPVTLIPNPARDHLLIITNGQGVISGTVYDLSGKELLHFQKPGPEAVLDIRTLTAGMYLLSIESGGTRTIKKFIKH
jgi:hypothetical protein